MVALPGRGLTFKVFKSRIFLILMVKLPLNSLFGFAVIINEPPAVVVGATYPPSL